MGHIIPFKYKYLLFGSLSLNINYKAYPLRILTISTRPTAPFPPLAGFLTSSRGASLPIRASTEPSSPASRYPWSFLIFDPFPSPKTLGLSWVLIYGFVRFELYFVGFNSLLLRILIESLWLVSSSLGWWSFSEFDFPCIFSLNFSSIIFLTVVVVRIFWFISWHFYAVIAVKILSKSHL